LSLACPLTVNTELLHCSPAVGDIMLTVRLFVLGADGVVKEAMAERGEFTDAL
jgi:hypothetical protein